MSWIFGGGKKAKPTQASTDVDEDLHKKKKNLHEQNPLLGEDTSHFDYLKSGHHKPEDHKKFASELAELGFDLDERENDIHTDRESHAKLNPLDLSKYQIPDMTEEDITLTEDDMNDPELLAEFESVNQLAQTIDIPQPAIEGDAVFGGFMESMSVDELKKMAISLSNSGRKQDALEVMRRINLVSYSEDVLKTVSEAEDILKTPSVVSNDLRNPTDPSKRQSLNQVFPPDYQPFGAPGDAKSMAVQLKKAGYQAEALQWLRYAKQVEAGAPMISRPVALSSSQNQKCAAVSLEPPPKVPAKSAKLSVEHVPSRSMDARPAQNTKVCGDLLAIGSSNSTDRAIIEGPVDAFSPLERALQEASEYHLKKASAANKELSAVASSGEAIKLNCRTTATENMKLYKMYSQELTVLQSRRHTPGASPALFRWETSKQFTPVENTYLAEDQLELVIERGRDMEVLLSTYSHRRISISYNIGIPRDNPLTGTVAACKYVDGQGCSWNFKAILPFKRGRSLHNQLERKKAVFELTLHRGMFSSDVPLGVVSLPLADLLIKVVAGGDALPLTKDGRGKNIGGTISAYVKLRTPIDGPEMQITEERRLIVDPWPEIVAAYPPIADVVSPPLPVTENVESSSSDSHSSKPQDPYRSKYSSQLTEKELNDPLSPDFLESNDVMDAEVETVKVALAQSSDPDETFDLNCRLQIVERNLSILIMKVQNEQLSMENYLDMIRNRLKRDQLMALHFKSVGDTSTALKIMKRIKIMTSEIENATAES